MVAVLQRVTRASVEIAGERLGEIGPGLMILLGVEEADTEREAVWLAEKAAGLRIFPDQDDKMNRSLLDAGGEVLCVSNFTLCADCKKGRRPAFIAAMKPPKSEELYHLFCEQLRHSGVRKVTQGVFGAEMQVSLVNDGPVTILLDTAKLMPHR